ncbi:uncharacterized protein LOC121384159 [Gigantopelta aegis]|uniref:uncharacterized protein LOC121384159 n=1 Tax=Gigantopelta aegis TaxID=1735272 RepID=UPI001B888CA3|nr:uncharacterized protein LOC121384159 [Gigantopelta aegis]
MFRQGNKMKKFTLALLVCNVLVMLQGKPSEPVALYLHTEKRSWNEANHDCQKDNMRLVTMKDSTKHQILQDIYDEWNSQGLISGDFWFGLFDTSTGNYSWTDCEVLGTWTSWDRREPDVQATDKCNRIQKDSFKWRTRHCAKEFNYICEIALDCCWYDTYPRKTLTGSLVSAGIMNLPGCKNHCLTKDVPDEECAAFTFTGDDECLLLMRNKLFLENDTVPGMEFNTPSVSGIKRCFVYYSTNTNSRYVDSGQFPNFTCPITPPAPTQSSSPELCSLSPSSLCASSSSIEPSLLSTPSTVCSECLCNNTISVRGINDTSGTGYASELILNKANLSSHRRKLTSAKDSRPSAVMLGTFGCGNIALCFVILVILDCSNLVELFQSIIHSDRFIKDVNK